MPKFLVFFRMTWYGHSSHEDSDILFKNVHTQFGMHVLIFSSLTHYQNYFCCISF